jgi:hypothetical protein
LSGADLADYSQFENEYKNAIPLIESQLGAQEAAGERSLCEGTRGNCTKYWHGAVDGVHLIENTAVAGGDF